MPESAIVTRPRWRWIDRLLVGAALSACSLSAWTHQGEDADLVADGISHAADWINGAAVPRGGPERYMAGLLLPMDIAAYKAFVQNAYAEPPKDLGTTALSAFLQLGGKVNARVEDVCFLLYNVHGKEDLVSQFIAPHDAAYAPSMAPYLFLAAHEYGHCMDFRARGQNLRPTLQGEAYADIFAILLLRKAGVPIDEISSIIASRKNAGPTHSTLKWCQRALSPTIAIFQNSIEDLARLADNLVEARF